eukprot:COSAG01_NODE_2378_length_7796_cov_5.017020_7_plen_242_part_00
MAAGWLLLPRARRRRGAGGARRGGCWCWWAHSTAVLCAVLCCAVVGLWLALRPRISHAMLRWGERPRRAARLACLVACFAAAAAHGSLTLPIPRNNKGAQPPFGKTIYHNPGCQGDACLWFSEGCYNGCERCTGAMPNNTKGGSANTYGAPDPRDCPHPTEPTLPERFRTWNIQNKSLRGDFTRYHPWRSPGRSPTSDACGVASGYPNGPMDGNQVPAGYQRGLFARPPLFLSRSPALLPP